MAASPRVVGPLSVKMPAIPHMFKYREALGVKDYETLPPFRVTLKPHGAKTLAMLLAKGAS